MDSIIDEAVLTAAGDVVREFGHHDGRFSYSGHEVVADPPRLLVHRVANDSFDRQVALLVGPDVPLVFADASFTRAELQLAREIVWALGESIPVESVSIPVDGTELRVVVGGSVQDAQAKLDRAVPGQARAQSGHASVGV